MEDTETGRPVALCWDRIVAERIARKLDGRTGPLGDGAITEAKSVYPKRRALLACALFGHQPNGIMLTGVWDWRAQIACRRCGITLTLLR